MKPRILVVDDEEKFVDYLSKRLINQGYDVSTSLNGEDAIEKVKQFNYDVVILDVLMPGIDGIEALREIKGLKPLTEVIMLTGHASVESGIEGMKLGAYDYLMKPCETQELVSKINKAYERKADQEERIRSAKVGRRPLVAPFGSEGRLSPKYRGGGPGPAVRFFYRLREGAAPRPPPLCFSTFSIMLLPDRGGSARRCPLSPF